MPLDISSTANWRSLAGISLSGWWLLPEAEGGFEVDKSSSSMNLSDLMSSFKHS